jgi:hypothetical protein
LETIMFRKSMFLMLGLIVALTLGCEKKEEAPAVPETDAATQADAEAAGDAAGEAVEEAAEAVEEAADEVKDAVKDIEVPGQ